MKINIFVPFFPFRPGGGLKVMFEYANHLVSRGHTITLYYPARMAFFNQGYVKPFLKYWLYKYRSSKVVDWFIIDNRINIKCILNVSDKSVDDGDIIFSTWWSTMYEISKLSSSKGVVFNLIQDIETWAGFEEKVKLSYSIAHSTNLVIADHLYEYVGKNNDKMPLKIQIAVDQAYFCVKDAIVQRDGNMVIMMYSIEPRKGSNYGLDALKILKIKYPLLKAIFFSVTDAPPDLPDWIEYYKNPSNLPGLYNRASVFLSSSIQEGCALPPMEAMNCGCAVVCTDIEGHKAYAFDGETALLVKPRDVSQLAEKIAYLFENAGARIKIAERGSQFIKSYSWEASTIKLEAFFQHALEKPVDR
jgi:glycosyltransferase involved in cell wall biosynthesis